MLRILDIRPPPAFAEHYYTPRLEADRFDEEENEVAKRILSGMIQSEKLTEYERSQVLQYLGLLQHNMGNTRAAIESFEEILSIESLEPQFRKQALITLAQLCMVEERYTDATMHMERWFSLEQNPAPEQYVLYGKSLYHAGRYEDMTAPIEKAIEIAGARGAPVKEDWYALLSFAYFQRENYGKVRDIHKTLIANWPRKRYWMSIAGAFSELGEESRFASAYSVAHTQGFLTNESQLVTMAQLYLQRDVPYKAARLLEAEIESGRVSKSAKNYRLLSQAWTLARNDEKSIPPLRRAADLSEDGELDVRLGNAHLSLNQYEDCEVAIQAGLRKGGLKNPDYAQTSLGMCLYNQRKYSAATDAFKKARNTPRSRKTADEWIRVIKIEKKRDEDIAVVELDARRRMQLLKDRQNANRGS